MNQILGGTGFTWGLNIIFFVVIGYFFYQALQGIKEGKRVNYVEYTPTLLTSLGLLGTFLGILIGLLNFNPNNIDGSIKQLLGGLQTAFITSLMGMVFAIIFKIKQTTILDRKKSEVEVSSIDEVSPKDIHDVLLRQYNAIALLASSIGGDSERSMVGQLQMLRTDVIDFRTGASRRQEIFEDKLWEKLNNFAEVLSKSATDQVIEALKQVIVEFNEKLTEQFGDNFKRLDESVKKLVEWQANYMIQLEAMSTQYEQGVIAIDATKLAVQDIRVETSKIPANMESLNNVMQVNQHQIQELDRHLDAFVKMRDQAVIAVPGIQQKLEQVSQHLLDGAYQVNSMLAEGTEQIQDSIKQMTLGMLGNSQVMATQSEHISKELGDAFTLLEANTERIRTGITSTISTAMESMDEKIKRTTTSTTENIATMLTNVQNNVDSVNQSYAQHTERTLGGVEKQVQQAVTRTNEAVNEQLRQLDEALSRQLNAALQELGSSLATIANHMVKTVYDDKIRTTDRSSTFS